MLRTLLLSAALLAASSTLSAHERGYVSNRIVTVEPEVSVAFGSLRHDGFQINLNSGGPRYIPQAFPPFVVLPQTFYRNDGWREDRREWREERRDWREARRHSRHHRRHGHHDDRDD